MSNNANQFEEIVGQLQDELSLLSDKEYYRRVLNESREIYDYLQKEYKKGLDEIELTDNDLRLFDYIKERLPHSFWGLNDLSEVVFLNDSLVKLKKCNYRPVDDFVQALCEGGWDDEIIEGYEFDEEWPDDLNEENLDNSLMQEYHDYESVCNRLAGEKGGVIEKSKLSRRWYFGFLAKNHIHIEDSEADRLLFEHIKLWLLAGRQHLSKKETINWSRYVKIDTYLCDYKRQMTFWFNYKPSLYELPLVRRYALYLCSMGNTNTLAKLITWDHFLRSNIKSLIEEYEQEMVKVEQITDTFVDNIDRMWRRFFEIAIETCPVENDQMEDEFLHSGVDDYVRGFESIDSQHEF